jgi:hypothetical protein
MLLTLRFLFQLVDDEEGGYDSADYQYYPGCST